MSLLICTFFILGGRCVASCSLLQPAYSITDTVLEEETLYQVTSMDNLINGDYDVEVQRRSEVAQNHDLHSCQPVPPIAALFPSLASFSIKV